MYALISPNEIQVGFNGETLGIRVAQLSDSPFPVAEPLFWIDVRSLQEGLPYYDGDKVVYVPYPVQPDPLPVMSEIEL
jgi:hypothetical protein